MLGNTYYENSPNSDPFPPQTVAPPPSYNDVGTGAVEYTHNEHPNDYQSITDSNDGPDTSGIETGSYRVSNEGYTAGSSYEQSGSSAVFRPATQADYDERQWGLVHVPSEERSTGQLDPEKSVFKIGPKLRSVDEYDYYHFLFFFRKKNNLKSTQILTLFYIIDIHFLFQVLTPCILHLY